MNTRPSIVGFFNKETQVWDILWTAEDGTRTDVLSRPGQSVVSTVEMLVQKVTAVQLTQELAAGQGGSGNASQ